MELGRGKKVINTQNFVDNALHFGQNAARRRHFFCILEKMQRSVSSFFAFS